MVWHTEKREKDSIRAHYPQTTARSGQHIFGGCGCSLPMQHLPMQVDVEALDFDLAADAQADGDVDRLQDREGDDRAIEKGRAHVVELHQQLVRVAVGEPALAGC